MSCFCYLHIFPNDKIYVGTTQKRKPEYRWRRDGSGYIKQPLMWNAICKYGWENVKHQVIVCETPEEMWEMERELIKEYDTTNHDKGYNCSLGGESGSTGVVRTEEYKKKQVQSHKGQIPWNKDKVTPESVRQKQRESAKNRPPITEETRKRLSKSHKGKNTGAKPKLKWLTPNGKIKYMDKLNVGRWHPDWKEVKDD